MLESKLIHVGKRGPRQYNYKQDTKEFHYNKAHYNKLLYTRYFCDWLIAISFKFKNVLRCNLQDPIDYKLKLDQFELMARCHVDLDLWCHMASPIKIDPGQGYRCYGTISVYSTTYPKYYS